MFAMVFMVPPHRIAICPIPTISEAMSPMQCTPISLRSCFQEEELQSTTTPGDCAARSDGQIGSTDLIIEAFFAALFLGQARA